MISTIIITACDVTFYSPKKSVKSPSSFLQNNSYCKSSIKWCGLWRNSPGLIVAFPLMDYVISSTVFTFRDLVSSFGFFSVLFTVFFFYKFIYLFIFIFGCVGSSFLCEGFL